MALYWNGAAFTLKQRRNTAGWIGHVFASRMSYHFALDNWAHYALELRRFLLWNVVHLLLNGAMGVLSSCNGEVFCSGNGGATHCRRILL